MLGFRPQLHAAPWPYDAVITVASKRYGLMEVAKPYYGFGDPGRVYDLMTKKLDDAQASAPTDYSTSSRNPFIEGTRSWERFVNGAGVFIRDADRTHDYAIADGVDASLDMAILGPASAPVTPSGSGVSPSTTYPITQIIEFFDGTNTLLYALAGTQVWRCAGNPATAGDWALSKEFAVSAPSAVTGLSTAPSNFALPVISSVVSNTSGGGGGATWKYRVVALDSSGATHSTASVEVDNGGDGEVLLDATHYNDITWAAVTGAHHYDVYLTVSGGTPVHTGLIASGITALTYRHDGTDGNSASVPAAATGATTYSYKIVSRGSLTDESTSVPSSTTTTAVGPATLSSTLHNTVAWSDNGSAFYEVWRTVGGTNLGLVATVTGPTATYNDVSPTVASAIALPTVAKTPTPTMMMSFFTAATNYLYVGMTRGTYWRTADGTTWAQGTGSGSSADHYTDTPRGSVFTKIGRFFYRGVSAEATRNGNHIYRTQIDPFTVVNTTRAATGWESWGGDSGEFPFTSLQICNEQLVAFTTGFFGIGSALLNVTVNDNTASTPVATTSTGHDTLSSDNGGRDADNGRTSIVWGDPSGQRSIYARHGGAALKITPSSSSDARVESIGLERLIQNQSDINGYATAFVGHSDYFLYFTIYHDTGDASTSVTHLCKLGSWFRPSGDSTKWEWAPNLHFSIAKWTGVKCKSLAISNVLGLGTNGHPRLIIGMDNGTFRLIVLPANGPSPIGESLLSGSDSLPTFQTSGTLTLATDDAGFGANLKVYKRATVLGNLLTSTKKATLSYEIDNASSFTDMLGDFTATGMNQAFFTGVTGKQIRMRLNLASNSSSATPQVHEVQVHATVRGPTDGSGNSGFVRTRQLVVQCMDGIVRRDGHPESIYTGQQIRDILQAATAASNVTITLRDGVNRDVSIINAEEGEVIGRNGERTQIVALDFVEQALAT